MKCKSQHGEALKNLSFVANLSVLTGWVGDVERRTTLCKSTNKFQTMVLTLAKVVVQFFNELIGIYFVTVLYSLAP